MISTAGRLHHAESPYFLEHAPRCDFARYSVASRRTSEPSIRFLKRITPASLGQFSRTRCWIINRWTHSLFGINPLLMRLNSIKTRAEGSGRATIQRRRHFPHLNYIHHTRSKPRDWSDRLVDINVRIVEVYVHFSFSLIIYTIFFNNNDMWSIKYIKCDIKYIKITHINISNLYIYIFIIC